ncbi:MAG: hypothetical protein M1821_000102 [Bathelium mastoideum]|nr:MAG: hypothetical protein M1821_000102 [Bathelium mastoideum]KAI9687866.1 MAG: hypothetical protein M1822_001947 [Bathelium mastoideum]
MHLTAATLLTFVAGALAASGNPGDPFTTSSGNPFTTSSAAAAITSPPSGASSVGSDISSHASSDASVVTSGGASVESVATSGAASVYQHGTSAVASFFGFGGGSKPSTTSIPTTGPAYSSFTSALDSISHVETSILASLDASYTRAGATLPLASVSSLVSSVESSASAAKSSASTSAFTAGAPIMTGMPVAGAGALAAVLGVAAML